VGEREGEGFRDSSETVPTVPLGCLAGAKVLTDCCIDPDRQMIDDDEGSARPVQSAKSSRAEHYQALYNHLVGWNIQQDLRLYSADSVF
jgi:hypothetical protein